MAGFHARWIVWAIAIGSVASSSPAIADPTIRTVPPDGLVWEVTPEGVAFAALDGNRFAEPYMAMVRLPAGTVSPPHVKTAAMFGVVLAGVMTHAPVGAGLAETDAPAPLPSGAYYAVPAGLAHVSACISDVDCVTFLYQDGRFDFLPVQP